MSVAEILAAGETCKAIFCPTTGPKETTVDSSGFSAEETFISVSAVPHWRGLKSE